MWSLNTWAIIFAVLGACSESFGLGMVIWQIKGDRDRARSLLDKQRKWKPERRPPPRRVSASGISLRPSGLGSMQAGAADRHLAAMIASLVTGHNQLVRDSEEALDQRTHLLLGEIDSGDKELRAVLRELLGENIKQRVIGVVAIGAGIMLSMIASILSSLG
jgi:hypothetical protein